MARTARTSRDVSPTFWDVAIRDKGQCVYCGLDGSKDLRILSNLILDHLIPKHANGSGDPENLVLSCPRCNGDKGRWNPAEGPDSGEPTNILVEKAKAYVQTQRSRYYEDLFGAINSK
jgi:5-methylcytosine-specific restriction endonuclease McrA